MVTNDALVWLASNATADFDLVFLDPPFGQGLLPPALAALRKALVYVEHESHLSPAWPPHWQEIKKQNYPEFHFRLFRVAKTQG